MAVVIDFPTVQPTIDHVLAEFLDIQQGKLAKSTYRKYKEIVELLQICLDSYGYQALDPAERRRFDEAYKAGDEGAFCHLFGPEKIPGEFGEFLGYFMIHKVGYGGETLMRAAGTVTKKLALWLAERGYVTAEAAEEGTGRATDAARELPRAMRLGEILYRTIDMYAPIDANRLADEDYVEDYLTIEKIEPGALWFEGGIGPLKVPKEASDLAEVGWSVSVALGRTRRGWQLLEVGNVYP